MVLNARAPAERQWFRRERDATTGVELLRARLQDWSYGRHAHADYAIGLTEAGSQSFFCRGVRHRTEPGSVILFNPFDLHDGHASTDDGVVYRMAYVPVAGLRAALSDESLRGEAEPGFARTLTRSPAIADAMRRLAVAVAEDDALGRDEALVTLAAALRSEAGLIVPSEATTDIALCRTAERLADDLTFEHRIGALAEAAKVGRFTLIRSFKRRFGVAPSTFLRTLRLEDAKRRLAAGAAPADVAAGVGFADQAHLTRWFRRAYGMTPARYRSAVAGTAEPSTARQRVSTAS